MSKRVICGNLDDSEQDMKDIEQSLISSPPTSKRLPKKLKRSWLVESKDLMTLQQTISEHNEDSGFMFESAEQKRILESLITVEKDLWEITSLEMFESISTGLQKQYTLLQSEKRTLDWWCYQSTVLELNKILCQEHSMEHSIKSIQSALKNFRIHTPYDLFLISQRSLPRNSCEFTFLGMVNYLLDYQFKFRENIIFGTSSFNEERYIVGGKKKLYPDSFAQIQKAFGDRSMMFFKCERQNADTLEQHKDHFKMYVEMKDMLQEWIKALIKENKHTIENAQNIKVFGLLVSKFKCMFLEGRIKVHDENNLNDGIHLGYHILETEIINLETIDGVAKFTTVIETYQETLWKKILDEHRGDDSKGRSEHDRHDRSNNNYGPQNQQTPNSLAVPIKFIPDPMNEAECAEVVEKELNLSKFQLLPDSMHRCEWSCVGFYGHAFSTVHDTSVFVKMTAFREENKAVMQQLCHLQTSKSMHEFPNLVRIFEFQINTKLVSVVYNLMKLHNSGKNELEKLALHSTEPIKVTIQEKLLSLDAVMNKRALNPWIGKHRKMFFMNLIRQCFDVLFQLDATNIQHSDISMGNLMIRFDSDLWKRASKMDEKLRCFTLVLIDFNSSLLLTERDHYAVQECGSVKRQVIPNQSVDYVYKYPYSDPGFDMEQVDIYSMAVVIVNYLHFYLHGKPLKSKVEPHLESCQQYRSEMLDFLQECNRDEHMNHQHGNLILLLKYMLGTTEETQSLDKIKTMLEKVETFRKGQ
ncbi:hypothetical protein C9374_011107 [Naegleria lovaniensis]|uniref:Protein kinase domain-containing protein n=1 Tax=Naegleria lovaniensis TaxID=51637 RepID=A0AA88KDD4_NAELO|nr:uncharacterized protein C9374_011107 [Naegleria lovaniensis]KAG2374028.1 hypothetical protein C9374_011107 [Naegleria lovaniensis]